MKLLERFLKWWQGESNVQTPKVTAPPPYPMAQRVDEPPVDAQVRMGDFLVVQNRERPKWVLFQCPCGCRQVITLSLQSQHRPHWRLTENSKGAPSLKPSVWRDVGCKSHFFISEGYVLWARDDPSAGASRRHRASQSTSFYK